MASREVKDSGGKAIFRLRRYAWRSRAAASPLEGKQVRGVVVQDESGKFHSGMRVNEAHGRVRSEFSREGFETRQQAIPGAREMARGELSLDAERHAASIRGKRFKPGETMVSVGMDDGWEVRINAPGKLEPAELEATRRHCADFLKEVMEGSTGRPKGGKTMRRGPDV